MGRAKEFLGEFGTKLYYSVFRHRFDNTGDGVMRFLCVVPNDSY